MTLLEWVDGNEISQKWADKLSYTDLIDVAGSLGVDLESLYLRIRKSCNIDKDKFSQIIEGMKKNHIDDGKIFAIFSHTSDLDFKYEFQKEIENRLAIMKPSNIWNLVNSNDDLSKRKLILKVVALVDRKWEFTSIINSTIEELLKAILYSEKKLPISRRIIEEYMWYDRPKYYSETFSEPTSHVWELASLWSLIDIIKSCNINWEFWDVLKRLVNNYEKNEKVWLYEKYLDSLIVFLGLTFYFYVFYNISDISLVKSVTRWLYMFWLWTIGLHLFNATNTTHQIIVNLKKKNWIKIPV